MKIITKQISTFLARICSALLSLLGFSSCTNNQLMYGMPVGTFEIKGTVTDEENGKVSDAEIRVTFPDAPSGIYSLQETNTDSKGHYSINGHEYLPTMKIVCIPENADLQPDSTIVKLDYKDSDKHNSWDRGHAEATVNFNLKTKE